MLKRMLTLGLAIAVVSILSTVAFAFDYNTADDVGITLAIPTILVLDLESDTRTDMTWVEVTAADLDKGYMVRRAATAFVVDSNSATGWHVTVQPDQAYFVESLGGTQTASEMPISYLLYKSYQVTNGTMTASIDVSDGGSLMGELPTTDDFVALTDTSAQNVCDCPTATDVCQGTGAEILVDYKILMTWKIDPDTYCIILTYTLIAGAAS